MAFARKKLQPIASGLKDDICEFFSRFESVENVRYERFSELWREMRLSVLWSGRQTDREAREFMEECLRIVVSFWMPPCSFQTQVGALYLLYGFYWTQPCMPRVRIRLLPHEWREVETFYEQVKSEGHYDAEYVFLRLQQERSFYHVGIAMDVNTRQKELHDMDVPRDRIESSRSDGLIDPTHLESLRAFHEKYDKFKCQLAGPSATRPDTSLDFIHSDLLTSIHSLLEKYKETMRAGPTSVLNVFKNGMTNFDINGDNDEDDDDDDDDANKRGGSGKRQTKTKIGKTRQKLKEKAFLNGSTIDRNEANGETEEVVTSPEAKSISVRKTRSHKLYDSDVNISDLDPAPTTAICQATMSVLKMMDQMEGDAAHCESPTKCKSTKNDLTQKTTASSELQGDILTSPDSGVSQRKPRRKETRQSQREKSATMKVSETKSSPEGPLLQSKRYKEESLTGIGPKVTSLKRDSAKMKAKVKSQHSAKRSPRKPKHPHYSAEFYE